MDNIDDPWNFHQCKLCIYKTRYIHRILSHVRRHRITPNHRFACDAHPPENYHCEKCQFQSDLKVLLTEHVNAVHKSEETRHDPPHLVLRHCEKCDFETHSSLVLLSHDNRCDRSVLPDDAKEKNSLELGTSGKINHSKRQRGRPPLYTNVKGSFFQCSYCPYKAKQNVNLKTHILYKHTPADQINWFKCEVCSYKFKVKQALQKHMLSRNHYVQPIGLENKLKFFRCNQCAYITTKSSKLASHVLRKHANRKENGFFLCRYCSYKSAQSGNLKTHVINKHTPSDQINWFRCEYCPYKAKAKQSLHKHISKNHVQLTEKLEQFRCERIHISKVHPFGRN